MSPIYILPWNCSCVKVLGMLKKLKKDIDNSLKSFLWDISAELGLQAASGLLYGGIRDFLHRSGKRIRPILFLISYQGYTKKKGFSYEKLLRCSLSLELLHDFLLAHDDVIDKSALRRGKPALHRLFNMKLGVSGKDELGSNLGIVAGDIIFTMAIDALLSFSEDPSRKEQALKIFIRTAAATGIGEFIDVVNNVKKIEKITKKEVFLTYTLKTAKYTFEGPLLIGAVLAGADKEETQKLSRLGIILGQAFQIQDDLLDTFSSSEKIGKPVLSDLNESKKTLLVWKTYKTLAKKDKKLLKHLLEKRGKTYRDLLEFRKLIKRAGADRYCQKKAASLLLEADSICSGLRMRKKHKTALNQFIEDFRSKTETLT